MIDLDGFKEVNDSLGHQAGDLLLQQVASRLSGQVREEDTATRLGGDEFAVVLYDVGNSDNTKWLTAKVVENLGRVYFIDDKEVHISCSIGVINYPDYDYERPELMKAADEAMYIAKEKGKNRFEYYTQK
ncbi:MAG: diguanylate cyclase domain-containing protein [Neptuniibacter sp.]